MVILEYLEGHVLLDLCPRQSYFYQTHSPESLDCENILQGKFLIQVLVCKSQNLLSDLLPAFNVSNFNRACQYGEGHLKMRLHVFRKVIIIMFLIFEIKYKLQRPKKYIIEYNPSNYHFHFLCSLPSPSPTQPYQRTTTTKSCSG